MTNTTILTNVTWCSTEQTSRYASLMCEISTEIYIEILSEDDMHTWPQNLLYLIIFRSSSTRTCNSLHTISAEESTNQESSKMLLMSNMNDYGMIKGAAEQEEIQSEPNNIQSSTSTRTPQGMLASSCSIANQRALEEIDFLMPKNNFNQQLQMVGPWSLMNRGSRWNVQIPAQSMVIPESGHRRPLSKVVTDLMTRFWYHHWPSWSLRIPAW